MSYADVFRKIIHETPIKSLRDKEAKKNIGKAKFIFSERNKTNSNEQAVEKSSKRKALKNKMN